MFYLIYPNCCKNCLLPNALMYDQGGYMEANVDIPNIFTIIDKRKILSFIFWLINSQYIYNYRQKNNLIFWLIHFSWINLVSAVLNFCKISKLFLPFGPDTARIGHSIKNFILYNANFCTNLISRFCLCVTHEYTGYSLNSDEYAYKYKYKYKYK